MTTLDTRASLDFEDPEGQRFRLTADEPGEAHPWERSPVPAEHQVRGLGPIVMSVPSISQTDRVLTEFPPLIKHFADTRDLNI